MRVWLTSIGCRLNRAEMDALARQLSEAGHTVVAEGSEAEAVVVNTCAVTREAACDSRSRLRQAHRLNPQATILATGCWATLRPREAAALPGVTRTVPNREKDNLLNCFTNPPPAAAPPSDDTLAPSARRSANNPLPRPPSAASARRSANNPLPHTRAFVKVQDGCDNHCTFCVTTLARGAGRSRPLAEIVAEIEALVAAGFKEAVLTGVHLGSCGKDRVTVRFSTLPLTGLVRAILRGTDLPRLRLSSLEPWDLTGDFFSLWGEFGPRLCRHLHLPLQSGCAATLRRMARNTTPEGFAALVAAARAAIPDVAVTTDLIVGFPGEDEAEFAESLAFVEAMQFAGVHVFRFSPRPGTAAARMTGQVPEAEKKRRSALVYDSVQSAALAYRGRFVGRRLPVLWEATRQAGPAGFRWSGLSDNYLRVELTSPQMLWNTVTPATLTGLAPGGLYGRLEGNGLGGSEQTNPLLHSV
ncbi:MAG: tRNA (N(6)-L-threonylcarbamoyladenosine(37)-C(2))-methylthiotransferase MtaB [Chloroflexi bacterium]|nr:tRNA (N(6)-L-threonylcarbamoyladenosine(37)-C(2))-methylthiotransferase MtaB [Chloroflexota bacterium]